MNSPNQPLIALSATLLLLTGCGVFSSPQNTTAVTATAPSGPFTYDDYATVLETHVDEQGQVDYEQLKANRTVLDRFNASLATIDPDTYESWNDQEKIALWINAYNSLTLQAIIDNYPVDSIRNIPGVWKWLKFRVVGRDVTLDEIEHGILRQEFNEPRIHMGLVCASTSCPLLPREPFTGEALNAQLNDSAETFLELDRNFQIDREAGRVHLSSIFKWFGEDFEPTFGTEAQFTDFNSKERAVLNFVSDYLDSGDRTYLRQGEYQISYLDYDWSLNDQS